MRISRVLNVAVLSSLMAASAAVYAQEEKPQEPKAPRQQEPRAEPRQNEMKAPNQDEMKPAQQGDMKPERQEEAKPSRQEEAKPSKDEQKAQEEHQKQEQKQSKEQMKQERNHEAPASAQGNAGGDRAVGHPKGKSARIPDQQFKQSFGKTHTFVVQRTTVVQGQPGFIYSGVNFVFLDPWPIDWAYTDDCYVDYIDGEYFLFDVLHPGVRIALFVVL